MGYGGGGSGGGDGGGSGVPDQEVLVDLVIVV